MPIRPKQFRPRKAASKPPNKIGFNDKHKQQFRTAETEGLTTTERGYGYRWQKLRRRILLRDDYLCCECRRSGLLTPANEVDHIIPKSQGGTDDPENLQTLCKACHKKKTMEESQSARWGRGGQKL